MLTNQILFCSTLLSLCLRLSTASYAQFGINAPAGMLPTQDLEVYTRSGFLVQQKYQYINADPNASVNNLSCVSSPPNLTALAGILKDPNGDTGYTAGQSYSCTQTIYVSAIGVTGIELVFEDLDTEPNNDWHYGPMAQDFYAAFGHDKLGQIGCDTLIYNHDFAGVTFAGVQALIRENETLSARLAQQAGRLLQTEQNVRQANARLDAIEAVLVPRRRIVRR